MGRRTQQAVLLRKPPEVAVPAAEGGAHKITQYSNNYQPMHEHMRNLYTTEMTLEVLGAPNRLSTWVIQRLCFLLSGSS